MTNIFSLRSLINQPSTLSIVCILKRVYHALQLFGHGITLQKKKKHIVRNKYYWKIKILKIIVYFTFLCLTCAKECVLCVLGNPIFFLFSLGLSLLTSNTQTKSQKRQF